MEECDSARQKLCVLALVRSAAGRMTCLTRYGKRVGDQK